MTQDENAALVGIGRVLKAVGLDGLCSIEVFGNTLIDCATPFSVQLGETTDAVSDAVIKSIELRNKMYVCSFKGITDRDGAESLRDLNIYITQDRLPALGNDEYYHFELEGMDVRYEDGELAGTVQAVYNYPSTDALEVRLKDSARVTLPLIPDCVIRVDKKARSVFVKKNFLEELL